MILIKKSD